MRVLKALTFFCAMTASMVLVEVGKQNNSRPLMLLGFMISAGVVVAILFGMHESE